MKIKLDKRKDINISKCVLVIANKEIDSFRKLRKILSSLNFCSDYKSLDNIGNFFNFTGINNLYYEINFPKNIPLMDSINSILYISDINQVYIKTYKDCVSDYNDNDKCMIDRMRDFIVHNTNEKDKMLYHFTIIKE